MCHPVSRIRQKVEHQKPSQPNPGRRPPGSPCRLPRKAGNGSVAAPASFSSFPRPSPRSRFNEMSESAISATSTPQPAKPSLPRGPLRTKCGAGREGRMERALRRERKRETQSTKCPIDGGGGASHRCRRKGRSGRKRSLGPSKGSVAQHTRHHPKWE